MGLLYCDTLRAVLILAPKLNLDFWIDRDYLSIEDRLMESSSITACFIASIDAM